MKAVIVGTFVATLSEAKGGGLATLNSLPDVYNSLVGDLEAYHHSSMSGTIDAMINACTGMETYIREAYNTDYRASLISAAAREVAGSGVVRDRSRSFTVRVSDGETRAVDSPLTYKPFDKMWLHLAHPRRIDDPTHTFEFDTNPEAIKSLNHVTLSMATHYTFTHLGGVAWMVQAWW